MNDIRELANLLRKYEPRGISALEAEASRLGLDPRLLRGPLGTASGPGELAPEQTSGEKPPASVERSGSQLKLQYFSVVATERALNRMLSVGADTVGKLKEKVSFVDHLRLLAECLAAITGFFSATGVTAEVGTRILAGVACVSAVLGALIPRLAASDTSLGKSWAAHYSELVDALAKADAIYRRLTVWLRGYEANASPGDPGPDVDAANKICEAVLRQRLLLEPVQEHVTGLATP